MEVKICDHQATKETSLFRLVYHRDQPVQRNFNNTQSQHRAPPAADTQQQQQQQHTADSGGESHQYPSSAIMPQLHQQHDHPLQHDVLSLEQQHVVLVATMPQDIDDVEQEEECPSECNLTNFKCKFGTLCLYNFRFVFRQPTSTVLHIFYRSIS